MQRDSAPSHDAPARRPAVTRSAARTDEHRRFVERTARAAETELPALADTTDAPELALMQRALDACRQLRDAEVGTLAWSRAVLEACAIADEAQR